MNVWEVEFYLSWDYMPKGEFDEEPESYNVVASDYDSALKEAKQLAMADTTYDENEDKDHFVRDARIASIRCGQFVHAIAESLAHA